MEVHQVEDPVVDFLEEMVEVDSHQVEMMVHKKDKLLDKLLIKLSLPALLRFWANNLAKVEAVVVSLVVHPVAHPVDTLLLNNNNNILPQPQLPNNTLLPLQPHNKDMELHNNLSNLVPQVVKLMPTFYK